MQNSTAYIFYLRIVIYFQMVKECFSNCLFDVAMPNSGRKFYRHRIKSISVSSGSINQLWVIDQLLSLCSFIFSVNKHYYFLFTHTKFMKGAFDWVSGPWFIFKKITLWQIQKHFKLFDVTMKLKATLENFRLVFTSILIYCIHTEIIQQFLCLLRQID